MAWKWLLPIVLLVFVLACNICDAHEFRVKARQDRVADNTYYIDQNSPAWPQRISMGINFPALALDYPFREAYNPRIYERDENDMYISIAPKDIGFFLGVVLFWHWVGRTWDQRPGNSPRKAWPRIAVIAGLSFGLLFGLLSGAYASQMAALEFRPWRQIGEIGIVWAAALVAYFGWRLTKEFDWRKRGRSIPSPF